MSQSESGSKEHKSVNQSAILIAGDLLVLLSFVWIGRSSHSLSITDIGAGLFTALPFIIGWFAVTPWFGLYRQDACQNWRKLVPRLLIAVVIAILVSATLRALFLGRPIPGGIMPTFTLIALSYIGLVTLVWRLGYIWWINRRKDKRLEGAEL